ncbi:MAG: hypothetical protein PHS57_08920 [Alphaproteobacteria bacterium]|nr:hypothetical protein [Alphaproteobacteria bacterium]
MKQLNSYRFYELGAKLHALFRSDNGGRAADMFAPLSEAQALLDSFIKGNVIALTSSKADASRLLDKIGSIFDRHFIDPSSKQLKNLGGEDQIDTHELAMLHGLVEKFEHALAAELNRAPTYVADKCGIYSTYDLAENAQEMFSDQVRSVLPVKAQGEFSSAGRALAFGFGTASVVHILRAIEITLRSYYEVFSTTVPSKAERNYAFYIKKLASFTDEEDRRFRPDKRVIQMLAQIKERYRNPLVVMGLSVSTSEAMQLFSMASALMSMMAESILAGRRKDVGTMDADTSVDDDDDEEAPSMKEAG